MLSKVQRGDAYPQSHEQRVSETFERTLMVAASNGLLKISADNDSVRRLKVLEVGIGSTCRTVQRGLYNSALEALYSTNSQLGVDFIGVDLDIPSSKVLQEARDKLESLGKFRDETIQKENYPLVTLDVLATDIVHGLPFPDDSFDCITSSLVLCSVTDPISAIQEIKRVLRPGGTFGFVEHVAVDLTNEDERGYQALEWQQRTLDPLQQRVAHNCHLHRQTDSDIQMVFDTNNEMSSSEKGRVVWETERFFVKEMWPISCQCCGVVQKAV